MRKIAFLLWIALTITSQAAKPLNLSIFHYNDEHSFNSPQIVKNRATGKIDTVGGSIYLAGQVAKWRSECERSLLLDAGDEFTGGPISAFTQGKSQSDILKVLKPDMMCLGNHEFDYGLSALKAFQFSLDSATTLASANIIQRDNSDPLFTAAKVFDRKGVKIGVLALTTEGLGELVHPSSLKNISVVPVEPIARAFVDSMRKKVDVIACLTHQGVYDDSVLAAHVPGIDVIVGGHSHTYLVNGVKVNSTQIVQAGNYGYYLGRVDLLVDTTTHSVVQSTASTVPLGQSYGSPVDSNMVKVVNEQEALVSKALDKEVGSLTDDFKRMFSGESNVGNWVCETLKRRISCDIGLYNSGGIRVDILAGKVTKRHLWSMEPFGNSTTKVTVTGKDLVKMMEFRSTQLGDFIQTSGLKVQIKNKKVVSLEVNGVAVDPSKKYSIATNSYVVAQWDKYFGFKLDPSVVVDTGMPTRETLITEFEEAKTVTPKLTNWWHVE